MQIHTVFGSIFGANAQIDEVAAFGCNGPTADPCQPLCRPFYGLKTRANPAYRRHRPEQTTLYSAVSGHYPRFLETIEGSGGHLPKFVRQEFEDHLK